MQAILEILRGLDEDKKGEVKELLEQSFHHQTINNDVIMTYCTLYRELRGKGEQIPDADLIIAATAIANHLPLNTGDRHFNRLVELGLELL
jgi:hypothetical protein